MKNNKKNVVFLTSIINENTEEKYGGFEWMEYSKKSWGYWCKKNNCELFVYEKTSKSDLNKYRVTWQRWFDVFNELEKNNISYDKILVVDATSMIKWDAPNVFEELSDDNMIAWRDMDNLKWIWDSVQGYKPMFDDYKLDMSKYINCGSIIINKSHKKFFKMLEDFYFSNYEQIYKAENETVRLGTDQTPFNYFLQLNNVDLNLNLPFVYSLTHMHRKEMLRHNWQLNEDQTPFFIKYGYIWRFNGFAKNERTQIMSQVWNMVRGNYE